MLQANHVYHGDNLKWLQEIDTASVSCVYADPPFSTGQTFTTLNTDRDVAYTDTYSVTELIDMLVPVCRECHRILLPTGFLFLHGDLRFIHHMRIELDKIFGDANFVTQIVWKRCASHHLAQGLDNILDYILVYRKSSEARLNNVHVSGSGPSGDRIAFAYVEKETGRRYNHMPMDARANFRAAGEKRTFYKPDGTPVTCTTEIGWRWTQETIDERWRANPHIFYFTDTGRVRYKIYEDEYRGVKIDTLWDDIPYVASGSNERTGYPTQKPTTLLKRILLLTTREHELVVDPFMGSGTTCVAAKELNRTYIGIDRSELAIKTATNRLERTGRNSTLGAFIKPR